jgi:hypothetical protein
VAARIDPVLNEDNGQRRLFQSSVAAAVAIPTWSSHGDAADSARTAFKNIQEVSRFLKAAVAAAFLFRGGTERTSLNGRLTFA